MAIFLILFGLIMILERNRLHRVLAVGGLVFMAVVYLAGAVVVARLGAPEGDNGDKAGSLQQQHSDSLPTVS